MDLGQFAERARKLRSPWRERRLGYRLLIAIVLASTCLTLLATGIQLYLDYRRDLSNIDANFDQVERTYADSLANSLWTFDDTQLRLQLDGLLRLRDVQFVEVKGSGGEHFEAGHSPRGRTITREFVLRQPDPRQLAIEPMMLGKLAVTVGLDGVYRRLIDRAMVILATQATSTLFISVFILLIVSRWVTRHLEHLARFARDLSIERMGQSMSLQRRRGANPDELDDVAAALNDMSTTLGAELSRRAEMEAERARLYDAYEQNRGLLQGLIDNTPAVVYVKDLGGRYLMVNRRYRELFGNRADALGHTDADLFPPETAALFRENDRRVAEAGAALESEETVPHGDGVQTYLSLKFPLRGTDGKIFAVCGISTDISERKRLEERLRQAHRMESIGLLAGGIAHDFNNLLTPIIGNTELLLYDMAPTAPEQELLTEIHQAGRRAAALTAQLLAFGRKQMLELKRTRLSEVVSRLEGMLRRIIRESIRIKITFSPVLGDVLADAGQMEQVLLNLAINARDAMLSGGTLTIDVQDVDLDQAYVSQHPGACSGPHVMLAVSDTGIGMDQQTQGRLFEPFFTTKELGKGTGLGLSTVYGIVNQHGGSISVQSERAKGSTFRVYLPRLPKAVAGQTADPLLVTSPEITARAGESVFIVEDNDMVRNTASEMLRHLGYAVTATDGAEGCLRLAENHDGPIDLLLTDVVLAESNGKEVYDRLAARRKGLKVLYMSGYTDDVIVHQGVLDEGVHFIQKPLSLQSLARKVREVLDAP